MNPWAELWSGHGEMRRRQVDVAGELRRRLIKLAGTGRCSPTIRSRFTYQKSSGSHLRRFHIRPEAGSTEGEPVSLPSMRRARLQVQAVVDERGHVVHAFSAHLWGRTRAGFKWAVAVHLDDNLGPASHDHEPGQMGAGGCGHATFHCHVGPDLDAKPKVRVPFPAVGPEHALDWLLATVVPGFEPMPWTDLNQLLADGNP